MTTEPAPAVLKVLEAFKPRASKAVPARSSLLFHQIASRVIQESSSSSSATGHIKVCIRVRPFNDEELARGDVSCVTMPASDPTLVLVSNPNSPSATREFHFDRAYWSAISMDKHFASQATLMEELGIELRDNALEGYNNCLFAYGQTGSGKTYSVLGGDHPDTQGLLPRIVNDIFAKIEELKHDPNEPSVFTTSVSYLEIYNEQIRDLLAAEGEQKQKLEVRTSPTIGTFVQGIKDIPVFNHNEVKEWLDFGVKARAVASTCMNRTSSRSHCIFTLDIVRTVTMQDGTQKQLRSKVNLVDLAGSERQKKTQATGSRLKEGAMINQSLSNLALVISKLAEASKKKNKVADDFIPFRNSKLTFLLMDSLSGNSKTVMMAAISPAGCNYDETLSTLLFAQSVKSVRITATKNEHTETNLVQELQLECERLRSQMASGGENSHAQELAAAEELAQKYGRDFEAQLQLATSLQEQRSEILKDAGLTSTEMSQSVGLDKSTPHLLNVCYDPELNGCLVYFLQKAMDSYIGSSKTATIVLSGLGMQDEMVVIRNQDNIALEMNHLKGRVLLNGRQVNGTVSLQHDDRIILGHAFCFRLIVPNSEEKKDDFKRARRASLNDAANEVLPENSEAFQQAELFAREMEARIGAIRARAFRKNFVKVCTTVDEANEIARKVTPKERWEFKAEVLMDLSGSDSVPDCVVRLRKLETGKARFRTFVRNQIMNKKTQHLFKALLDLRLGSVDDADRSALLFTQSEFFSRMQYFRDVYQAVHDGGLEALEQIPLQERECWNPVPPWAAAEMAQERWEEDLALKAQLDALQRLVDAKDARIRTLEATEDCGTLKRRSTVRTTRASVSRITEDIQELLGTTIARPSRVYSADSTSLPTTITHVSAREAAHRRLLQQVQNAFELGLQRDISESQVLWRHIDRLEACESSYFQTFKALQAEIRTELQSQRGQSDEVAELQQEVSRLRAELQRASISGVSPQRASQATDQAEILEGALELVKYYVQQQSIARSDLP